MKPLRRATVPRAGNKGAPMRSPKTVGPAVAVSLVAATVAALAQMSEAAPAGPTANVEDADVALAKPPP